MYVRLASVLICLIYVSLRTTQAYEDEKIEQALRLLEQMTETRRGLSALRQVLDGIDGDLQDAQKRWDPSCAIGAGMPGYQCHISSMQGDRKAKQWLQSSHLSPGKRGALHTPSEVAVSTVRDLTVKRKGLDVLKKILEQMNADMVNEQKRTCAVNLGGHCATESAASMADQWHYLNSPLSPGRKRRDTGLYKKLVAGKIFN